MNPDRPKVLAVDDRPDNLLAVEAVLEPLAVDVVRATSGKEALRRLLTDEFALILLDVQMPELDGFETAAHIKGRERTRHVPIIFLTAISRELEHHLRGYGTGAVDYLAKRFEPEVLRAKVAVFVDLYEKSALIERQNGELAARVAERDRAQAALSRLASELERSNTELERFADVVSHDLREPLQVVAGFLDLLAERHGPALDDEARLLVDRASAGAERMRRLIGDLLAYAKASTGGPPTGSVSLQESLDGARAQLEPVLAHTGAVVTAGALPTVQGEAWQLTQLFHDLLDNAVKFNTSRRREVHVEASRHDGGWVVRVRDNGIGIRPEDVPRLFTIFARLHPREEYPGEGVGLAMCRRIVERHGGSIWAESHAGAGTTVCFTLPPS